MFVNKLLTHPQIDCVFMISFYDLDYIIESNEKRLVQYSNAYQKIVDKFTNILVMYSTFAIFLIPIIQSLFFADNSCYWLHHCSFYIFILLFSISLINSIRLLIPVEVAYLREPKLYYEDYRIAYESENRERNVVDMLIKASYVDELESAVKTNNEIFKRKGIFYKRAFTFSVLAIIPYLLCIGFQIAIKEDKVQKVEIVNNFSNFNKTQHMANDSVKKDQSIKKRGIATKLPGVDSSLVIPSKPQYIKEGWISFSKKTKSPKK
jgi:hypothetical protein